MNRVPFLISSSILCGLAPLSAIAQEANKGEELPMNIIYIMSDDHSYQTISAYSDKLISTPNIDRIANEGVRFTNSFVANSISGPSRACMLTGKHSHANGYKENENSEFDGAQQTFPKLLQQNGYQTAIIGKWHLTSSPTGFDYSDILIGQGLYYNTPFITNGVETTSNGYVTDIITDKAIGWIDDMRDSDKPFCLLVHHKAPHRSWMPDLQDLELFVDSIFPQPDNLFDDYEGRVAAQQQEMTIDEYMDIVYDLKLVDKSGEIHSPHEQYGYDMLNTMTDTQREVWNAHYDRVVEEFKSKNLSGAELVEWKYQQYIRDYLRVITSLDRDIGRLLQHLDSVGLLDNTMIVYTSDQGFYMGEHGWFDKRFMYEESFRTPLLVRLPGSDAVRGDIDNMVQNIDYAPTILQLAGVEIPDDIQGESFLPLLKGANSKKWRKSLYYHYYEYPGVHTVKRHYGVRTDRYKLIHFYNDIDVWELYDLKKDPSEMNNIYGKKGTERITKRLKEELLRLQIQYNDPIIDSSNIEL